jgi:mannose/cellobiose epimerase-like protein (N-acyl-D-glucosamine 2-epimerase family)
LILEPLLLERNREEKWLVPKAQHLFDTALEHSWDEANGGIVYGFDPDGKVCDGDKYFWVQAESLAATALLHARTGKAQYDQWYEKIWAYSWQHFVDHKYGAWYRILTQDNKKYDDEKSPAGKVDYHTMGACYEVLALIRAGGVP